jgi:hypothetical protein
VTCGWALWRGGGVWRTQESGLFPAPQSCPITRDSCQLVVAVVAAVDVAVFLVLVECLTHSGVLLGRFLPTTRPCLRNTPPPFGTYLVVARTHVANCLCPCGAQPIAGCVRPSRVAPVSSRLALRRESFAWPALLAPAPGAGVDGSPVGSVDIMLKAEAEVLRPPAFDCLVPGTLLNTNTAEVRALPRIDDHPYQRPLCARAAFGKLCKSPYTHPDHVLDSVPVIAANPPPPALSLSPPPLCLAFLARRPSRPWTRRPCCSHSESR